MGYIVGRTTIAYWVDDLFGQIDLLQVVNDLGNETYTMPYRFACLKAIGTLPFIEIGDFAPQIHQFCRVLHINNVAPKMIDEADFILRKTNPNFCINYP